jgi:hypothetical protein
MKKYVLSLAVICFGVSIQAQEKLTIQGQTGLALPYTDIRDFSYTGINHNITVGTGLGYYLDENNHTRLRLDLLSGKMAASNESVAWDNQFFEISTSYEYNILALIDKSSKLKLNLRAGVGMAIFTARAIDRRTRMNINEVPIGFNSQRAFEWGNFGLLGANFAFPISDRLAFNLGYNHRFMFSQNLDAIPSSSNDTYGVMTLGFTASLKSGRNPKKVEIEPEVLSDLRAKVDVYEKMANDRESERIAKIEMRNQELDAQILMLKQELAEMKQIEESSQEANQSPKLAASKPASVSQNEKFRVVIASLPTQALAERFVLNSGISNNQVEIFYVKEVNSFRVVIKSTNDRAEAVQTLNSVKSDFNDAWIARF